MTVFIFELTSLLQSFYNYQMHCFRNKVTQLKEYTITIACEQSKMEISALATGKQWTLFMMNFQESIKGQKIFYAMSANEKIVLDPVSMMSIKLTNCQLTCNPGKDDRRVTIGADGFQWGCVYYQTPKEMIGVNFGPPKISVGPVFGWTKPVNPDFTVGKNSDK